MLKNDRRRVNVDSVMEVPQRQAKGIMARRRDSAAAAHLPGVAAMCLTVLAKKPIIVL
jgi:hypothetical protein